MPGKRKYRWGRAFASTFLALFLSFSSLVPIAAQSFDQSVGDMPCCKAKGKSCCCRKRPGRTDSGPAISATCRGDCGSTLPGSVVAAGHAVIRLRVLTHAIRAAGTIAVGAVLPPSRMPAHSLRQRPPPTIA
jgi:hypothetical protein